MDREIIVDCRPRPLVPNDASVIVKFPRGFISGLTTFAAAFGTTAAANAPQIAPKKPRRFIAFHAPKSAEVVTSKFFAEFS